ncbi:MAG: hypothetical protein IJ717_04495 [Treponema sp.]|nr:hypothetical protein [Treponema sp.]
MKEQEEIVKKVEVLLSECGGLKKTRPPPPAPSNKELEVSVSGLDSSKFYKALFHATDTSLDDVKNALDSFLECKDKNIFVPIKNQINEGLKAVSEKFNQLYMTKKFAYSFEVDFDRMGLYLTMKRNGNAFVLSKQSKGFRYFFDLFLNHFLACHRIENVGTFADIIDYVAFFVQFQKLCRRKRMCLFVVFRNEIHDVNCVVQPLFAHFAPPSCILARERGKAICLQINPETTETHARFLEAFCLFFHLA